MQKRVLVIRRKDNSDKSHYVKLTDIFPPVSDFKRELLV